MFGPRVHMLIDVSPAFVVLWLRWNRCDFATEWGSDKPYHSTMRSLWNIPAFLQEKKQKNQKAERRRAATQLPGSWRPGGGDFLSWTQQRGRAAGPAMARIKGQEGAVIHSHSPHTTHPLFQGSNLK